MKSCDVAGFMWKFIGNNWNMKEEG